jgi:hypothetical protein
MKKNMPEPGFIRMGILPDKVFLSGGRFSLARGSQQEHPAAGRGQKKQPCDSIVTRLYINS